MKKIIALVMCFAMILSVSAFAVNTSAGDMGKITLTTTAKVTDPMTGSGTLTVTVNVTENTGVNFLDFKMGYNTDTLKFTSVTNGAVFSAENGGNMLVNSDSEPIHFLFEENGIENNSQTGKLVTVKFEIIDDMGLFDITVEIDNTNTFAKGEGIEPVDVETSSVNNITKNTQHITTGLPVTIKPTCEEAGRIEKRCTTCNKVLSVMPNGDALGHDWDEIDRKDATRYEDGYIEYECLNCYKTRTEVIPKGTPSPNAATLNGTYKIDGSKLTLTVTLGKNPGINTLVFDLGYNPEALELVGVTNGNIFTEANNASMFEYNAENNPLKLYFDENGVGNIKANGTVATAEFNILDEDKDFGLTLEVEYDHTIACGEGYVPVNVEFADSTVKEMSVIPGDLNGDGKVNAVDSNIMKQIILDIITPTPEQFAAADLNGDGKVNSVDANLLKQLVLGD